MKVDMSETGNLSRRLSFTVSQAEVNKAFDKFCEDVRDQVEVPGFRKGHATNAAILSKYKNQANKEVSAILIQDAVSDFYQKNINYTGMPAVIEEHKATAKKHFVGEFKLDGSFFCTVDAEVEPKIDIKDYLGIEVSEKLPDLTQWVSNKLEDFQYTFASREPAGERNTEVGDELIIDFEASVDNVIRPELKIEMQTLVVGNSGLPKVVDEQLVNRPIKEDFEFDVVFPNDYGDPETAGKTVHFKVFIHSVSKLNLHPVNEDLAKLSAYDSLEHMKQDLEQRAKKDLYDPIRIKIFSEMIDLLIKSNKFDVPKHWIDVEYNITCSRLGLKELPKDEQLIHNIKEIAERVVRQNLILSDIYRKEQKIQLSAEEISNLFIEEGKKHGLTYDQLTTALKKNNQYDGFLAFYQNNRTIDFLIDSAKTKSKE